MPSGGQTTGPTEDVNISDHGNQSITSTSGGGNVSMPNDTDLTTVSGVARVNATTKFIDDDDTIMADASHDVSVPELWNKINDTQKIPQSLEDFFKKPFSLIASSFTTADTYLTFVNRLMPYDFLQDASASMWTDKLKGFTGARFDMRFRLVVNANKFQQGRYIMGWVPLGGASPSTNKRNWFVNAHAATLVQRTTLHHVEIDLNTETSAELVVPFASIHNYFNFNNGLYTTSTAQQLGVIAIYPYSPVVSPTGSTSVPYRVYVSFENVRLFGAATAQSGIGVAENAMKSSGPISGIATNFANGFKEFAKIPLISTYARSAQWVMDRTAKVASIFGFSKPTAGDNIVKMSILNNSGHTNVDGSSDARSLSFLQRPAVVSLEGLASNDIDEMDFSSLIRRYVYNTQFAWTTGDAADALLLSYVISPLKPTTVGGTTNYGPMSFVNQFFQLWRGSIKVRIKIVKTVFHSGRLAIYFTPAGSGAASVNQWYFNRHIVDIREHNEIEIVVPYMSQTPWTGRSGSIGELRFVVVDPLVAPSSVSTSATMLLEIAAGDDMEFAVFNTNDFTPTTLTPQSGIGGAGEDKCVCFTIGNSQVDYHPTIVSATTIGDKVSNFRTLLKRYCPITPTSRVGTTTSNFSTVFITVDQIPVVPVIAADSWKPDLVGVIGSCYMMWTGGIRIKDVITLGQTLTPGAALTSNMVTATLQNAASQPKIIQGTNLLNASTLNRQVVLQQIINNNTVSLEIPQYTQTIARNICDCLSDQGLPATDYLSNGTSMTWTNVSINLPLGVGAPAAGASTDVHNIFRALSDDGSFHLFISIPPMLVGGSAGNSVFF